MKHFLLITLFVFSVWADVFKVYTEQNPPYNYIDEGKVSGISTTLVETLFSQCGHQVSENTIQLLPWARAYHEVLNEKNTMLYSMARSPEREALFQWVGPIGKMTLAIIAKKSTQLNVSSQFKKLKENRIDAIAFSVEGAFSLLKEMGCNALDYEVVYVLKESDLYFAFHKDTNQKTITAMNETLKTLIK